MRAWHIAMPAGTVSTHPDDSSGRGASVRLEAGVDWCGGGIGRRFASGVGVGCASEITL